MIPEPALEDELGDVLEKALKLAGLNECELAKRTGIDVNRIKDALDYRHDFSAADLARLADTLGLNETGLVALANGRFPMPDTGGLPFCLRVVAMPYGAGVVNAFIFSAGDCSGRATTGVLVDSGCCPKALASGWPSRTSGLYGQLVTHWNPDHVGGCFEVMKRFNLQCCHGPGPERPGVCVLQDGSVLQLGEFRVETLGTPGPTRDHLCYLVGLADQPGSRKVLFSGDLFFCGSVGGGFHDPKSVVHHARRLWRELPGDTVVAPGHGPLTTIETEREFNPFARP